MYYQLYNHPNCTDGACNQRKDYEDFTIHICGIFQLKYGLITKENPQGNMSLAGSRID